MSTEKELSVHITSIFPRFVFLYTCIWCLSACESGTDFTDETVQLVSGDLAGPSGLDLPGTNPVNTVDEVPSGNQESTTTIKVARAAAVTTPISPTTETIELAEARPALPNTVATIQNNNESDSAIQIETLETQNSCRCHPTSS